MSGRVWNAPISLKFMIENSQLFLSLSSDLLRSEPHSEKVTFFWEFMVKHVYTLSYCLHIWLVLWENHPLRALKQMFFSCPLNFFFFWHQTCMDNPAVQLTGKTVNIIKSPYFSTLKRVIFSQHVSYRKSTPPRDEHFLSISVQR